MIPDGLGPFTLLAFTSLLAITNPMSSAPVYMALTAEQDMTGKVRTLRTAVITAGAVLVTFAILGGAIFQIFSITLEAFRIAGGIILFEVGLDMLQAKRSRVKSSPQEQEASMDRDDVGVFPLGIPMIVGPGAITTVMVLVGDVKAWPFAVALFLSIVVVLLINYVSLRASPVVMDRMGTAGVNVVTRIMGLLLTVISVQFVIDGVIPVLADVMRAAAAG